MRQHHRWCRHCGGLYTRAQHRRICVAHNLCGPCPPAPQVRREGKARKPKRLPPRPAHFTTREWEYRQFITKSPVWRKLRTRRLRLADYHCERCRATQGLEVHHATYDRFGGNERMDDLRVWCKECHAEFHAFEKELRREQEA